VVDDGLVTGQNPASSAPTANALLEVLGVKRPVG
jgi:putative intracellular protease/amidase